jgi:hypothetical protein
VSEREHNPLRQALAGTGARSPHPDADMLTAFREGTLMPRERDGVLGHLAECAECRQVLGVAAEYTAPVVAMPVRRPVARTLAPWLAAAAVLLAVSGIVVRQEMRGVTHAPTVAVKETPPAPGGQTAPASVKSAPAAKEEKEAPESRRQAGPARQRAMAAPANAPPPEGNAAPATGNAGQLSEIAPQAEVAPDLAGPGGRVSAARIAPQIAPRPAAPAVSAEAPTGGPRALDQVAVSASPPAPTTTAAFASADATRALEKVPELEIAPPCWRINAKGQPERAFGAGRWERVPLMRSGRMHAIAVEGAQVWTGGEDAALFRSSDNGTTWTPVSLPEKGARAHTIAHIRIGAGGGITVEATDGTTWVSEDGGATWK